MARDLFADGALAATVGAGCWRLSEYLIGNAYWRIGLPLLLFAAELQICVPPWQMPTSSVLAGPV